MNSPISLISNPDVVALGLRAGSGEEAITALQAALAGRPGVVHDPARFLVDLLERARLSSVCISEDIALPHARTAAVDRLVLGIARAEDGVRFDDAHPAVKLIFLVGTPRDALAEYLHLVAALSRLLRNPEARRALLGARDEPEFRAVMARALTK